MISLLKTIFLQPLIKTPLFTKKHYLFLDIDGVLNSHLWEMNPNVRQVTYRPMIDPKACVRLVNALRDVKNLEVVMISSWRDEMTVEQFNELFLEHGIKIHHLSDQSPISKSESVINFVKKNKVKHFAILDDEALFNLNEPYHKKQIKTSLTSGFMDYHVEDLRRVINE